MKCPGCRQVIEHVRVYSECWQYGTLEKNRIIDYTSVEEILETNRIECPECYADLTTHITTEEETHSGLR